MIESKKKACKDITMFSSCATSPCLDVSVELHFFPCVKRYTCVLHGLFSIRMYE
jgi:hypothetical protein